MCLFKYREKKYGKLAFVLFALCFIAIAAGAVFGGITALYKLPHWSKYIIIAAAGVVTLLSGGFGLFLLAISFSMTGRSKSVRDVNSAKGISGTRLCDKCGRVITKNAQFCEHCGVKQETGLGLKKCPNCKTKNSGTAHFCEKCGYEFKE